MKFPVQIFQREQVGGDVLANGGVRATAGFDGAHPLGFQRLVSHEKLAVLFCKNIIRYRGELQPAPKPPAQLKHQGRLAAAHGAANTDSESASAKVAVERQLALMKPACMPWPVVRRAVAVVRVKMEERFHG